MAIVASLVALAAFAAVAEKFAPAQNPSPQPAAQAASQQAQPAPPTAPPATQPAGAAQAAPSNPAPAADPAVERAKKTVRMLDDIYKSTVVLITDKYVHTEDDFAAGSAAVALFSAITEKGWHRVRLIDVSGLPHDPSNVARDDFERAGVARLKAGGDYYEAVVQLDGKPYLRALTPVPVVMQKCVMCHPNYADVPAGAAIGAISYAIPIE
jgi:hypothetical protein